MQSPADGRLEVRSSGEDGVFRRGLASLVLIDRRRKDDGARRFHARESFLPVPEQP